MPGEQDRRQEDGVDKGAPTFPKWVLFAIVSIGVVIVAGMVVMVVLSRPTQSTEQAAFPMAREAFKTKLMGKTMDETVKLLGLPENNGWEQRPGSEWWYSGKAFDPTTGMRDALQILRFDHSDPPRVEFVKTH
jgi:hypothetical protein